MTYKKCKAVLFVFCFLLSVSYLIDQKGKRQTETKQQETGNKEHYRISLRIMAHKKFTVI